MSNANLIAEARRNAPESVDESLIMRLVVALEAAEPRVITTVEELDALPNGTLVRASGRFASIPTWDSTVPTRDVNTGHFTACTLRPVPREWAGGKRIFELLSVGASRDHKGFTVTTSELLDFTLPAIVLHDPTT